MKQLLTIFALLLLCMAGYAAETYVVNSPNLNMRVAPNGTAEKMGSLTKGDVIQVDTIINGWASFGTSWSSLHLNDGWATC